MNLSHLSEANVIRLGRSFFWPRFPQSHTTLIASLMICGLAVISLSGREASHFTRVPSVIQGPNVKVTLDNNNVDGVVPTPSFDARNRDQEEVSVAIRTRFYPGGVTCL